MTRPGVLIKTDEEIDLIYGTAHQIIESLCELHHLEVQCNFEGNDVMYDQIGTIGVEIDSLYAELWATGELGHIRETLARRIVRDHFR